MESKARGFGEGIRPHGEVATCEHRGVGCKRLGVKKSGVRA